MINYSEIDTGWSLFLDRDGVINIESRNEYVLNRNQFKFSAGATEALKTLSSIFGVIVIVTNQRGVARELMTIHDLHDVHDFMIGEINASGGRIDQIYYCTDMDNDSTNRKPNHGMALQAKADRENIDFGKSIMVGNKLSDMQFGRNAGMKTIYITSTDPEINFPNDLIDEKYESLYDFAMKLISGKAGNYK